MLAISLALARSRFVQLNRFFNERQPSAATTTATRYDNFSSCSTRHLTLAYELERNSCFCCFICVVRLCTYNRNYIHTDTHTHICTSKRHVTFLCCFCCCQLVEGELSAWIFASLLLPTSLLCSLFSARCTSSVRLMCFEFLMKFFAFELIAAVAAQHNTAAATAETATAVAEAPQPQSFAAASVSIRCCAIFLCDAQLCRSALKSTTNRVLGVCRNAHTHQHTRYVFMLMYFKFNLLLGICFRN